MLWAANHGVLTHVVLVAHGSTTSIKFIDGWASGSELAADLVEASPAAPPRVFLSLACSTGYAGFSKGFSGSTCCASIAAPFQAVHGAIALQYAQAYFSSLLVAGSKPGRARRRAQEALPRGHHFVEWRKGKKVALDRPTEADDGDDAE